MHKLLVNVVQNAAILIILRGSPSCQCRVPARVINAKMGLKTLFTSRHNFSFAMRSILD